MKATRASIKPYLAISGCFLLSIIILKVVEFFISDFDITNRFQLLVNALTYNSVIVSWVIIGMGIVYFLLSLMSQKAANIVAASFFGFFLVSEVGLTIYALHNGFALGSEFFARPLSESLIAIRGAMGIVVPILLTVVLLGGFIVLALWRANRVESRYKRMLVISNRKAGNKAGRIVLVVFVVLMCLLSVFFKMSHLLTFGINNYFVYNKCHYLIDDSIYYSKYWATGAKNSETTSIEDLRLSDEELAEIIATHPEWGTPLDPEYPLERAFVADTFLNGYFSNNENLKPNIVIILVESMGHEYMGWGAMPFVDSLTATGLYWPNCLSASIRSYGAIPAITGSVGGPKSFQFGTMPNHNTLFSLLKKEGYNTRAYYGGEFTFDCIYEYLSAQRIDYMSPFYEAYRKTPEGKKGFWWGATDDFLFSHTIEDLNKNVNPANNPPHLSLITTLSMHEELRLSDKKKQDAYMRRVAKIRSHADAEHKDLEGLSSALFTNDYIRKFIHDYSKRADFNNTIFVITGDHASGRQQGDRLSYHHVPLIIWSPLVKKTAKFDHLVTHNDVTPALYSLLTSKYNLPSHPTVHWIGDGLGPSHKSLVIVNYMHVITDIIYHNVYYHYDTRFPPEEIYTFDTKMKLLPCEDKELGDKTKRQFELLTKLYFYTYHANRLTARPVFSSDYEHVKSFQLNHDIVCRYPELPPSEAGTNNYEILRSTPIKPKSGYSSIRINIEADIKVNKDIDLTKYPDISFRFAGQSSNLRDADGSKNPKDAEGNNHLQDADGYNGARNLNEKDKISKFFNNNKDISTEINHISLAKDFPMNDSPGSISIELTTPYYDDDYVKGVEIILSNVNVSFSYGK